MLCSHCFPSVMRPNELRTEYLEYSTKFFVVVVAAAAAVVVIFMFDYSK